VRFQTVFDKNVKSFLDGSMFGMVLLVPLGHVNGG